MVAPVIDWPPRRRKPRRHSPPASEDKTMLSPFWKTNLCKFHSEGFCRRGCRCPFAHGEEELRRSPDFERTSVCPNMLSLGRCKKPGCRYAHSSEELREEPLLKTKLCGFHLQGRCVVGSACRFAHTVEELRDAAALHMAIQAQPPQVQAVQVAKSQHALMEMRRRHFKEGRTLPPPERREGGRGLTQAELRQRFLGGAGAAEGAGDAEQPDRRPASALGRRRPSNRRAKSASPTMDSVFPMPQTVLQGRVRNQWSEPVPYGSMLGQAWPVQEKMGTPPLYPNQGLLLVRLMRRDDDTSGPAGFGGDPYAPVMVAPEPSSVPQPEIAATPATDGADAPTGRNSGNPASMVRMIERNTFLDFEKSAPVRRRERSV